MVLSINFTFVNNLILVNGSMVKDDLNITSTMVTGLAVGFIYMFTLTVERSDVSSTTPCGSILLTVGIGTQLCLKSNLLIIIKT